MTEQPIMTDETMKYKGELHYVWPHGYLNGNSVMCYQCRYFAEDSVQKEKSPYYYMGECHSKAHQTERGYIHRKNGWDKTANNNGCKWWFPIQPVAGEQAQLLEEE